jgi:hypothetical protein
MRASAVDLAAPARGAGRPIARRGAGAKEAKKVGGTARKKSDPSLFCGANLFPHPPPPSSHSSPAPHDHATRGATPRALQLACAPHSMRGVRVARAPDARRRRRRRRPTPTATLTRHASASGGRPLPLLPPNPQPNPPTPNRQVWRLLTHPGTFHALVRAVITAATGGGWSFQWPEWAAGMSGGGNGGACASSASAAALLGADAADGTTDSATSPSSAVGEKALPDTYYGAHPDPNWDRVISAEKELAFFKSRYADDDEQRGAGGGGASNGAGPWELMMDKDLPGKLKYTAWRRTLPDGKTEYKSVTVAPDSQPEEIMDLFLDDDYRRLEYDGMLTHTSVLEAGDFGRRQQVVRWVRRFPFAFLSDREYAIGRCLVREPASALPGPAPAGRPTLSREVLYGLTRAVRHPREDRRSRVVRMDVFWSHWRSRGVPCPWGSSQMACETVLLHHEQFKIPENLARFAVRHGMWGFVRSLGTKTAQFVAARRERGLAPDARDPRAYGAGVAANPPTPEEVARAEAEEAALLARGGGSGGGKASRQASAQLPPLADLAAPSSPAPAAAAAGPETPSGQPPQLQPLLHMARSSSQAFSVGSSFELRCDEEEEQARQPGDKAATADPAFVSWAHSGPVVARLRTALPSLPPGSVSIHHSLSNASVAGLATVPSMVWSKIARVGSFGGALAALAAGVGGGGAAGADADGGDSVLDFCDTDEGDAGDDASPHAGRRGGGGAGGRDQGGLAAAGGGAGDGRSVSFAAAKAAGGDAAAAPAALHLQDAERRRQQQQHQRKEDEQEQQRRRVRRAAAAVLAAGALALAVGGAAGGGNGGGGGEAAAADGERRRRRRVAALPSPAEEQRRRRERQRQHRELRSCDEEHRVRAEQQQQQQHKQHSHHRRGGGKAAASPSSYPPLTSFPL